MNGIFLHVTDSDFENKSFFHETAFMRLNEEAR